MKLYTAKIAAAHFTFKSHYYTLVVFLLDWSLEQKLGLSLF